MSKLIQMGQKVQSLIHDLIVSAAQSKCPLHVDEDRAVARVESQIFDRLQNRTGFTTAESVMYEIETAFRVLNDPAKLAIAYAAVCKCPEHHLVDRIKEVRKVFPSTDIFDAKVVVVMLGLLVECYDRRLEETFRTPA